jgi:signal transduction histidine kinase
LVVHDDGTLGIPPAQQERIFDRFVRLDNARERSGGTGLGLAIVKTIAERHGGTVCVDDSDGTRFIVTLPRDPPGGPAALASAPERKDGALR